MRRNSLRRLGALVLALALSLTLAPPVGAADQDFSVKIVPPTLYEVKVNDTLKLTANVLGGPTPGGTDGTVRYEWRINNGGGVELTDKDTDTVTVTGKTAGSSATIMVYATWAKDHSAVKTVYAYVTIWVVDEYSDPNDIKIREFGLNADHLILSMDKAPTGQLNAIIKPDNATNKTVTWESKNEAVATVDQNGKVTAHKEGGARIVATAGGKSCECSVTVQASSTPVVPATGVTLNKNALGLAVGGSETLVAALEPEGATGTVAWAVTDGVGVVTVDQTGKVTAVKAGNATVTATVGAYSDTCAVTVSAAGATGVTFNNDSTIVRGAKDTSPWELSVSLTPTGAVMPEGGVITWSAAPKQGTSSDAVAPTGWEGATGTTVRLTDRDPGDYTFTAEFNGVTASRDVTVSGIVLNAETVTIYVGQTRMLAVEKMYGYAQSGNASDIVWTSSDPSVVTVVNGELQPWKLGTAVITANKNGYTATCKVTVAEDEDAVINGPSATASEPLTFNTLYSQINALSLKRTQVLGADGKVETAGSPLNYITNVTVPVEQGTLYYNYDSEANTGAGVGATDRFVNYPTASILETLDKLYFVPRQGFNGTAEISFVGWAQNGSSFSVTVKVEVRGSQGILYKTTSGQPAYFQGSDFNAYCRAQNGRDLSYVTFNLPQSSQGGLYYGYMAQGQYAGKVSTTTQYGRTGKNTIDDVCFVPSESFVGVVNVSFRGVDTAGKSFNGQVVINVTSPSTAGDKGNVYQTGQWGEPVKLQPSLFNSACQATIGDTLAYVRFQLPDYKEGVLYYDYKSAGNYDSRVDSNTRYYYSGSPGLGGVTFVPASNEAERVSIPYTGYGEGGTSFTGTLYITLGEEERTSVYYSAGKGGVVTFNANDFNNVALYQMGTSLEYVTFQLGGLTLGQLYYNYRGTYSYNTPVVSGAAYYRYSGNSWLQRLDQISFHAGTTAGSNTIPFTGYSAADNLGRRQSFQGELVLQVGAESPADVTLSGYSSSQIGLSSYGISAVCRQVMNQELSYIRITSLPDAEQGKLYYGYNGFKTGSEVKNGDRYYCLGTPSIDQLSFVPRGGYSGQAEITYIGYNRNGGEQVSGKIVLSISRAATSRLYNDMGNHGWAVDAVEFLSLNGIIQGVGGGRYNPTGQITKGDFALMLVRAFGFTASGTVRFNDVPADSYYAQAISVAHQLGIATGYNGSFEPRRALSRQEAMLMVYRALKADGDPLNNGLTADLSVYRDSGQIAAEARPALGALILMGVVEGDGNGTLRPQDQLNRAETASLLHRLMTL